MTPLEALLSYLLGLAVNERSSTIAASRERNLQKALDNEDALKKAFATRRSLSDEIRTACVELARNRARIKIPPHEKPLWRLLSEDTFQSDLVDWFMVGAIEEGNEVKKRLLEAMSQALASTKVSPDQRTFLQTNYFDSLEKTIFAHPTLAHWRHQLSLDFLREQVSSLRQRAEEAAGHFSPGKQQAALDNYCETALAAWDIIDLSNLPEGDIHLATQKLLLRQLYMPLRIEVEPPGQGEDPDTVLARIEEDRNLRRHREAGHFLGEIPGRNLSRKTRASVGERLAVSRRLVVLGDPGGGKTTMLRWMATAYLLRLKGDDAFNQVPDTETLPVMPWVPVLIRCRDLGEADLCRCFADFLTQHLNKSELLPAESEIMRTVILDRIAKGKVLLLVDGLDEITNPTVRVLFCQELERTAARYPDTSIVVTSRIVGYRDMPYRMGAGFEHGQIAELNREDKDRFAHQWVEVTEQHHPPAEKEKRAKELLDALHSSDRVEHLTGNPMLLTTLALVKRKVGKLPNKRAKLYAEAVSVLLNWNPMVYKTIEEDEAIPQLEYLAYEMCFRGVQRLAESEVLDLLDRLRVEYPNVRAVKRRTPENFLALLEARSSILIKSGGIWRQAANKEEQVWEFRHLTFQEYLAARALLDGRYPNRDKTKTLAQQVAPLAGSIKKKENIVRSFRVSEEDDIPESWREALRLLVADCKDDDVDDVLRSILTPEPGEDADRTIRPRAALAALCLADEPNVSEEVAQEVLITFASSAREPDGEGVIKTSLDRAVLEVGKSTWRHLLKTILMNELCQRQPEERSCVAGLWGEVEAACWFRPAPVSDEFFADLVVRLQCGDQVEVLSATIAVMVAAYEGKVVMVQDLVSNLLNNLRSYEPTTVFVSAWALGWLSRENILTTRTPSWTANESEVTIMVSVLERVPERETETIRWLADILGIAGKSKGVPALISRLSTKNVHTRCAVIGALGRSGEKDAFIPLLAKLDDEDSDVRRAVSEALGRLGAKEAVGPLLTKLDDEKSMVRHAAVEALGRLGAKEVVGPLLAKLDDENSIVRQSVVKVLGILGAKEAVKLLLPKLDDEDSDVREAVVKALANLGDKRTVEILLPKLNDPNSAVRINIAGVLHALGESKGTEIILSFCDSDNVEFRQLACQSYAIGRDAIDQQLLSRDLDAYAPWRDPIDIITDENVVMASEHLDISQEEIRSRYEAMASELRLRLEWKSDE